MQLHRGCTQRRSSSQTKDKRAQERRLEGIESCLQKLKPDQRELIVEDHRERAGRQKIEGRRDLAKRLGISMNALGIRASRIRSTLEACVEETCKA